MLTSYNTFKPASNCPEHAASIKLRHSLKEEVKQSTEKSSDFTYMY